MQLAPLGTGLAACPAFFCPGGIVVCGKHKCLHSLRSLQKPGEKNGAIMLDTLSMEPKCFLPLLKLPALLALAAWVVTGDSAAGSAWHGASG